MKDLENCIFVENIYVCNEIGGTFNKPDYNDCISKVALNYTIFDIASSCTWSVVPRNTIKAKITKLSQGTYMIASFIQTAITIHCALEREHKFEKINKGNTKLHVKDDCMVEETSRNPNFKIMPTTAALKNVTYIKEYEEP